MAEPGAVLLLSFAIAVVIRVFWIEILQLLIFVSVLAVVTGVVAFMNLIAQANG